MFVEELVIVDLGSIRGGQSGVVFCRIRWEERSSHQRRPDVLMGGVRDCNTRKFSSYCDGEFLLVLIYMWYTCGVMENLLVCFLLYLTMCIDGSTRNLAWIISMWQFVLEK